MHRLQTTLVAFAAAVFLGSAAIAQNAATAPNPAGKVITDKDISGPSTGTTGTGNANGVDTVIRMRPASSSAPVAGGTVSPSAGTTERASNGTGIVPAPNAGKAAVTGGVTGK